MSLLALLTFVHDILAHVPWFHWMFMIVMSVVLMGFLWIRKKCSAYAALALGIAVFIGLLLLDTAVYIRYLGFLKHRSGHHWGFAINRLLNGSNMAKSEIVSNIAVFVPFGFFLAEWLASLNRTSAWRRIGHVALASFGLSLCIECLQLSLHVGFFELTDFVMNTLGGFVGALISAELRKVMGYRSHAL